MKINLSDKIIAYLALLSGLTISAVAIWYSVAGLVSIFAAAVVPIIVMGVALEVSKLIATVWLKLNWSKAPVFIRTYLLIAIAVLMVITSMGIFGFLSKAHSDQSLVSGDVQSKIAIYDEKIKTAKENIEANRRQLKQMDEAVDQVMARSTDEKGAEKANAIRRSQQRDRASLAKDIEANQKLIASLNDEAAPIRAEVRKVEAEVGPIKYIAAFVYGDNPDANVLEKAVTWVIIIIVVVFDPLAVILLLASQYSFQWFRKQEEQPEVEVPAPVVIEEQKPLEEFTEDDYDNLNVPIEEPKPRQDPHPVGWMYPKHADIVSYQVEDADEEPAEEVEAEDHEILESASISEAEAMTRWKHDHPDNSLKLQRRLLARGAIDELPWIKYIEAKPDYVEEAEKWAEENPATPEAETTKEWANEQVADIERPGDYLTETDSKKKDNMDGTPGQSADQENSGSVGYVQNSEQSDNTLWKRIKKGTS